MTALSRRYAGGETLRLSTSVCVCVCVCVCGHHGMGGWEQRGGKCDGGEGSVTEGDKCDGGSV